MRIENLTDYPAESVIEADLVIIGGGPAGLTIASELADAGLDIVIVESGLACETPEHTDLNRIESDGSSMDERAHEDRRRLHESVFGLFDPEAQPFGVRGRGLNGSARYWGGKTAVFDESDFSERAWVPNSGWPIDSSELTPYLARAEQRLNVAPTPSEKEFRERLNPGVPRPSLDTNPVRPFFWQFSRSSEDPTHVYDFQAEFRAQPDQNARVLLNATVTQIHTTPDGDAFERLDLSTLEGISHQLIARRCVLAAGGIENPRLLLVSDPVHVRGIGNTHDQVGRYLMDHPGTQIGHFRAEDLIDSPHLGFFTLREGERLRVYSQGLTLSDETKAREGLLNAAAYVVPEVAEDDPIEAIRRLLSRRSQTLGADLFATIRHPAVLAKNLLFHLMQNRRVPAVVRRRMIDIVASACPAFLARGLQPYGGPRKWSRFALHAITEQSPNPMSRVALSDELDPLGMPRAHAHWVIGSAERRSILHLAKTLSEACESLGLPAPELADWILQGRPEEAPLVDMGHIMGTTRMSDDPERGVVDRHCQVHGVEGLYVAGSSVFPTSGHANPTLTLVALSIRLADWLKAESP